MNYKEKSDVDNVEMRASCSNCGLAAGECHCPDQDAALQDNRLPIAETEEPADSAKAGKEGRKDVAQVAKAEEKDPAQDAKAKKTNHVYGAGVFFRWRLTLAVLAVTILTAICVFATAGEDLPFLWAMATRVADPDKSADHFVSTVVRSASPHNRPFFLMFASVLRANHIDANDKKNLSQATRDHLRSLQLVQAQKDAREAASLFKERNDPRFEAAAIGMAIATTQGLGSDSSQELARLADLVALKDLPKSEGPRFSKFFSFGEILDPYECLIAISISSSNVKEAKYEAALYQRVLDSMKDEHDKKKYELLFAYSHSLLVSGDRHKAMQIRKQAIEMGSSNHPLADQLTGRLADTLFQDSVATHDWDDAKAILSLQSLEPARRRIGLAFCCFANGEDAAGKQLIDQINDDISSSPGPAVREYIQSLPVRRQELPALAKVYDCLLSTKKYTDASLVAQSVVCQSAAGDKQAASNLLKRERYLWRNVGSDPQANQRADREIQLELGTLFLVCDDVKNARATFEQLQRLDQQLGASKDTLSIDRLYIGLCSLRSGNITEARSAFEQVRNSNPKMAGIANLQLAKVLVKTGKTKEAQALLTTVMQHEDGAELDSDSLLPNEQFYLTHITVCTAEESAALYISENQYTKAAEILKQLDENRFYVIDEARVSGLYRLLVSKGITIDGWVWKSMQANPRPEIKSLFDRFLSGTDAHLLLEDLDHIYNLK